MARKSMFEKALSIVPRHKLDEWARDCGNDAPWRSDRKALELQVTAGRTPDLSAEVAEYVSRQILREV